MSSEADCIAVDISEYMDKLGSMMDSVKDWTRRARDLVPRRKTSKTRSGQESEQPSLSMLRNFLEEGAGLQGTVHGANAFVEIADVVARADELEII